MTVSYKSTDDQREAELVRCFRAKVELWLDERDFRLLGVDRPPLRIGERESSETGERRYSAAWL